MRSTTYYYYITVSSTKIHTALHDKQYVVLEYVVLDLFRRINLNPAAAE